MEPRHRDVMMKRFGGSNGDERMQHVPFDIGQCVRIGEACGFQGVYSAVYWDPQGRRYDPLLVAKRIIHLTADTRLPAASARREYCRRFTGHEFRLFERRNHR